MTIPAQNTETSPMTAGVPLAPRELLDRLAELACLALGVKTAAEQARCAASIHVAIVPLRWTSAATFLTCGDTRDPATDQAPVALPANARSYVLMPLPRPRVSLVRPDTSTPSDLALCIWSAQPRMWIPKDLTALATVARTAAAELQWRFDLTPHKLVGNDGPVDPLHDPATEVGNRELFMDRLEMTRLRFTRHPEQRFAVMAISVEQFDSIETTLGHEAARDVLREFVARLRTALRDCDTIARIAGDQFGILLESVRDESDPARVAMRVHEGLRSPIETPSGKFMVSVCVGIVLSHAGIASAPRLMQLAGLSRLRAKSGGAPYEIYDASMQEHARARLEKEMELRHAVEAGEFDLHYQPIVSLDSGRIVQTEALLRWRHPQRGIVAAADFIGLAEDTGLAVPIGWFSLDRACQQYRSWSGQLGTTSTVSMSVNITAAHFRHRDITERFGAILRDNGVSTGINLEVTERMLIGEPARASAILRTLRELGLGIHLDDFGTGYSSLQYLHEMAFDAIKIDRGFVARMRNGGRDAKVVATIRELARQLGVPVIAEGVETAEHLALVRDLGCEFAQGYFFSRPQPAREIGDLISSEPAW